METCSDRGRRLTNDTMGACLVCHPRGQKQRCCSLELKVTNILWLFCRMEGVHSLGGLIREGSTIQSGLWVDLIPWKVLVSQLNALVVHDWLTTVEKLTVGDRIHGYTVEAVSPLPEFDAVAAQLSHDKTKASHLHIARQDSNNTFR